MKTRYFHIVLAVWIFAVAAPLGLSESFNGRPTASEMNELVTLGTECSLGLPERCYGTQHKDNPVTYYVSPTNFAGTNAGWYLNQAMMEVLDSKAKAVVPYYAKPTTVYDGTTNVVMLSVPSLWAELKIGDQTNKFTGTPAIGTNPPTYGDYPWRMYPESLKERHKVLHACHVTLPTVNLKRWQRWGTSYSYKTNWYEALAEAENKFSSNSFSGTPLYAGAFPTDYAATWGHDTQYRLTIRRTTGYVHCVVSSKIAFNMVSVNMYMKGKVADGYTNSKSIFDANGVPNLTTDSWHIIRSYDWIATNIYIDIDNNPNRPAACSDPRGGGDHAFRGYFPSGNFITIFWNFDYCEEEY